MENNLHSPATRGPLIEPPSEAKLSTILNGMGNGAMLGGLPFLLLNLYEAVIKKSATTDHVLRNKVGLGLTVFGCALGGYLGAKEADRLREYREALGAEMTDLRAEINATKQRSAGWAAKEDQRMDAAPVTELAR
jgi:hypothetical protein